MAMFRRPFVLALAAAALPLAAPAAAEEETQLWLQQSFTHQTSPRGDEVVVELNERFRSETFGGDQYQGVVTLRTPIGGGARLGAGVSYVRTGALNEARVFPQVEWARGAFNARGRLEVRFLENARPAVFRARLRGGVNVPTGAPGLDVTGSVEGFWTLNEARPGAQTGLTAVRSLAGLRQKLSPRLSGTLAYLRQQEVRPNAADRIGNAVFVGLAFTI